MYVWWVQTESIKATEELIVIFQEKNTERINSLPEKADRM